jgi:WD repeat-containing protein 35
MESFKTRYVDAQITSTITTNNIGGQTTNKTLDTLITSDLSNLGDKALNNPWKGAEAFHYYMLCQNQMYNK